MQFYFQETWDFDKQTKIFRTSSDNTLWIKSFDSGIATADPPCGGKLTEFAAIVAGCFDEDSNFAKELFNAFGCSEDAHFSGIQFTFNGVSILVTEENANKDKIYSEWLSGAKTLEQEYIMKMKAYEKTPEYRKKRAKALKAESRMERVRQDLITVDNTTEFEFKSEEAEKIWLNWIADNPYARHWAKYMQHLMNKHGKSVFEVASQAARVSEVSGLSNMVRDYMLFGLQQCWKYGDDLWAWHIYA